jgi:GxxExxY protein
MEEKELENDPLTRLVIGAAIEIHKVLGPGLLESAYEECMAYEFTERKICFRRQMVMPVIYKGIKLRDAYRLDFLIEDAADSSNKLIVELKAQEESQDTWEAQMLTYLKMSKVKRGLLLNFHVPLMKLGIRRFVI